MSISRDGDERSIQVVFALILVLVVVGGTVDLVLDRPTSPWSAHVIFEVALIGLSLGAAGYLARGWYTTQRDLSVSRAEAERLERDRSEWERRAADVLEGLGSEIANQFDDWSLTGAERRVALMLLQGYSHKRIARVTQTSERTVRQHSVSVYRKSGVAGRAELAGFFLGPMILPGSTGDPAQASLRPPPPR